MQKYKDRLINISSRNRSLVMRKLYKKNSFDLHRMRKYTDDLDLKIVDFLTGRSLDKIKLLPDQYQYAGQLIAQYKAEIDEAFWQQKRVLLETVFDSVELAEKERELKERFELEFQEKIEKAKRQSEEIPEVFNKLSYLNREINAIEKETGRYELYVGYPYVEGCFKDGTFVKAPLLLYPVRIIKDKDSWLLDNIEEQYILINKVFLMAFEKYNNINLKEMETEFYDLKEKQLDTVEGLLKYLEDKGITIKDDSKDIVEKFQEHSGDMSLEYGPGELVLRKYLVLGRFPIANNSIYNDYIELEKGMIPNKLLDKLLINADVHEGAFAKEKLNSSELKEEDFFFMTPMDYSQEMAVKSVNDSDQLVIYGPPGTGKSQTIANIISDGLAKGKKILMVSQKRAALDVIYNRISELNSKAVIIHDAEKDKRAFYQKTADILEGISTKDYTSLESKIRERSLKIDEDIKALDSIGELLSRQRKNGLNLQEMYVKSERIGSREDWRYEDFRNYRENAALKDIKYHKLLEAVEASTASGIAEVYFNYKKCIKENGLILWLREDMDSFDAEEVYDKIQALLCQETEIALNINESLHLDRLLGLISDKKGLVDEALILGLADTINREENPQLLVKLTGGSLWNPVNLIKYGKNKKQEEANRQEFERRCAAISQELADYNAAIRSLTD
ncbi:AAA domain-containing protein [Clostridium thermarum]|uniref:AAA domain-containing protein n=1 Tax=Clostridium thermarum TaxID=1716543 RepID=UPI0013D8592F|nr:AAA domain-containing protein [Clostridium thermarum]